MTRPQSPKELQGIGLLEEGQSGIARGARQGDISYYVSQRVKLLVIWDAMTLMWQYYTLTPGDRQTYCRLDCNQFSEKRTATILCNIFPYE